MRSHLSSGYFSYSSSIYMICVFLCSFPGTLKSCQEAAVKYNTEVLKSLSPVLQVMPTYDNDRTPLNPKLL